MQQNEVINASICLTDISEILKADPTKASVSDRNGKMYLSVNIYAKKEPDQYGKDVSLSIAQTKEEREQRVPKLYIGNGETKTFERQEPAAPTAEQVNDLVF